MSCADIVIQSNAIFTGLDDEPFPGWLTIKENKILSVGKGDVPNEFIGKSTKIYRFEDNLVTAGFIDSHLHFGFGAAFKSKNYLDLTDTKSVEDCIYLVKKHLEKNPGIDHVLGMGWFLINWDNQTPPDKKSLDAAFPDIPLYLFNIDGHTVWLNSKALDDCGLDGTQKLSFGSFGRYDNGELNGLLFEIDAESFIMDKAFGVSDEDWTAARNEMFNYMARCGITSVGDMSAAPRIFKEPILYTRLLDAKECGELPVRVHIYPSLGGSTDFTLVNEIKEKYKFEDLQVCGLKQFVDGTTSMYSGCLLEDYSDYPGNKGASNYPPAKYNELITAANKAGYDVRLHAIGDGAVRIALDAMEESAKINDMSEIRNCVEHCENIHPDDIPRFAQIGAFASMQPTHLPLDMNEKLQRIGLERSKYEWPIKSLLEADAPLCFGSDYPVYDLNPLIGLHAAVTRSLLDGTPTGANPQEAISLKDALKAYTIGGAASFGRSHELGTLETGKFADITVLDKNLFEIDPQEYVDVKPILTMMDGNVIFEKSKEKESDNTN